VLVFIPELDQIILNSIKKQIMWSNALFQLLEVKHSYKKDNGVIETISAFRCQHKTHKLPTKGGTRYAENVDF
jgi:glutamate dehydrogenase/leucine dehydrogenase